MLFCMTAGASEQGAQGMINNPTNREEAVRKVAEACGGRLLGWYGTSGGDIGHMIIVDVPDGIAAQSIAYAAIASGVPAFKVTRLYTAQEMMQVAEKARSVKEAYIPPQGR